MSFSSPILPGFKMLSGSRACLIFRITSMAGPSCCSMCGALVKPVPCSALRVPFISIAVVTSSSAAGFKRFQSSLLLTSQTKVVWTLPSPTWPKVVKSMLYFSAIACALLMVSGILVVGTPKSSAIATRRLPGLILERVGTSPPLALIISSLFSGSSVHSNSNTLYFLHISSIRFMSRTTTSFAPSASITRSASILLTSLPSTSSTILRLNLSRISQPASLIPDVVTSVTASTATPTSPKIATARASYSGFASSFTIISVIIPRVPSAAQKSLVRS